MSRFEDEELKPTEPQIDTGNFHLLSNKLVDDNDSTTSAISAQHLLKYAKPSGTWECSCATRGGIECYQDLIEQPEMDTKSGDSIHSAEDEITDISLEFVEMVFDMAQSKKKRKTFWVSKTSEKIKKLLDKEIKKAYKAGEEERERVIEALTSDISTSNFYANGRSRWELNKNSNRGVEPCIECENETKIRTLLSTLDKPLTDKERDI